MTVLLLTLKQAFQSTLSVRRATRAIDGVGYDFVFQSTLSVRRATKPNARWRGEVKISIHALREESDLALRLMIGVKLPFQSTLSVRRATCSLFTTLIMLIFQSTLSVRRAT